MLFSYLVFVQQFSPGGESKGEVRWEIKIVNLFRNENRCEVLSEVDEMMTKVTKFLEHCSTIPCLYIFTQSQVEMSSFHHDGSDLAGSVANERSGNCFVRCQ